MSKYRVTRTKDARFIIEYQNLFIWFTLKKRWMGLPGGAGREETLYFDTELKAHEFIDEELK